MTTFGTVNMDRFVLDHRDELICYFVDRGRDRALAERVVTEALLQALVKAEMFDTEHRALVWVREFVCPRLFGEFASVEHLLSQIGPRFREALRLRARGESDETVAARLGVPLATVPAVMRDARRAAFGLREQF